ncbi:ATP-dependent DNA ligase [Thermosulfidibacter takaii ABI70S6]|uniref:ATP-dependent DNA ligase n=1 Tax=Thermosulfidibacter takaii (strain DSM 17441 / JCM 13301 / NBRC 103674 / ABI70S6) TaxID=1298851 RepID=A0A0S3QR98_THET7|nr:RNA ligase [Thermosulfidibacter takaii]BAT70859.1 ATP-dependent DNA ligase [Thermosulfidibacter takaii ABI70S6]
MDRVELGKRFFESLKDKKRVAEEEFEGIRYYRLKDDYRAFLRGTVYVNGEIIVGYPRIPRILSLSAGLKNVSQPFWMEEKADGYNVRIAKVGERILAFTRGGYVCPFTTDRLVDFADFEGFFRDNPHLVIAGEVVGRNTPYTELCPRYVDKEVAFFAFDVFEKNNWRFWAPEERYELLSRYDIPQVCWWGPFTRQDLDKMKDILVRLNEEGCEGVVIKGASGRRMKYVLPNINVQDIEVSSFQMLELPPEFFTQRIVRLVLASKELGIPLSDEIYRVLGRGFCEGLSEAVESFRERGKVVYRYTLRFINRERARALVDIMNRVSRVVRARILSEEREGGYWKVVIEKDFMKSTGKLASIFGGSLFYD